MYISFKRFRVGKVEERRAGCCRPTFKHLNLTNWQLTLTAPNKRLYHSENVKLPGDKAQTVTLLSAFSYLQCSS